MKQRKKTAEKKLTEKSQAGKHTWTWSSIKDIDCYTKSI